MVKIYTGLQRFKEVDTDNVRTIAANPHKFSITLYYWNEDNITIKFSDKEHYQSAYKLLFKDVEHLLT